MRPLDVLTWKWGRKFAARHVNTLASMLRRHLPNHTLVCITDDPAGLDPGIRVIPLPEEFSSTPRCRRRMMQFSADWTRGKWRLRDRILVIDLDVVILADLTPIVNRPEPICGWKVGHAGVLSGSFLLFDNGILDACWRRFARDPEGYPAEVQPRGVPSDQAMLNHWLQQTAPWLPKRGIWTEADGFVSYYGAGYERLEHLGVGPSHPTLPPGARIVVLGSDDLAVLEQGQFPWVREHWR